MSWFKSWFRVEEKLPESEAEKKLKQIADILFPPLQTKLTPEGETKYQIDYSADSNLEAALYDLEDGNNDEVAQNTIRKVADKLFEARKLLQAYNEIDPEAKYILVDDETGNDIENIKDVERP